MDSSFHCTLKLKLKRVRTATTLLPFVGRLTTITIYYHGLLEASRAAHKISVCTAHAPDHPVGTELRLMSRRISNPTDGSALLVK
jgi:hypothetical protein